MLFLEIDTWTGPSNRGKSEVEPGSILQTQSTESYIVISTVKKCVLLVLLITTSACVSVDIGGGKGGKKAEGVKVKAPAKPFREFEAEHVDQAWRNEKNGNSISYLSECNSVADPSLENIHRGLVSSIDNVANVEQQTLQYNGREALRSTATGQVDGVSSKFDLMVFKKNGCTYIISYVATEANFAANRADFDRFLQSFSAP